MQVLRQSQKPLCLRRQAHEEGTGSTKHVSKNDEVMPRCRYVTLLRHAIEDGKRRSRKKKIEITPNLVTNPSGPTDADSKGER
jgi:hypothetical protein